MRLVDIDSLGVISFIGKSQDFIDGAAMVFDMVHSLPTVELPSCILDEEASNALMDIILKENAKQASIPYSIEKSKSEIVPDYRDGWRLKDTHAEYWDNLGKAKEGDAE